MSDIYSNFGSGTPFNFGAPALPQTPPSLSLLHLLLSSAPRGGYSGTGLSPFGGITGISGPVSLPRATPDAPDAPIALGGASSGSGLGPGIMPPPPDSSPEGSLGSSLATENTLPSPGGLPGFSLPTHSYNYQSLPNPNDYYKNLPAYPVPNLQANARKQALAALIGTGLGSLLLGRTPGGAAQAGTVAAQGVGQGLANIDQMHQAMYQRALQMANQRYQVARQSAIDQNAQTAKQQGLDTQADANALRKYGFDVRNQNSARAVLGRLLADFPKYKAALQKDLSLTEEQRGQQLAAHIQSLDALANMAGIQSAGLSAPERVINSTPITTGTTPTGQSFVRDPATDDMVPIDPTSGKPVTGIVRDQNFPEMAAMRPGVVQQVAPFLAADTSAADAQKLKQRQLDQQAKNDATKMIGPTMRQLGTMTHDQQVTFLRNLAVTNPILAKMIPIPGEASGKFRTMPLANGVGTKQYPILNPDYAMTPEDQARAAEAAATPIRTATQKEQADTARTQGNQRIAIAAQSANTASSRLAFDQQKFKQQAKRAGATTNSDPSTWNILQTSRELARITKASPDKVVADPNNPGKKKLISGTSYASSDDGQQYAQMLRAHLADLQAKSGVSPSGLSPSTSFGGFGGASSFTPSLGAISGTAPSPSKVGFGPGTGMTGVTPLPSSSPAPAPVTPQHHSATQPRVQGKFAGPPSPQPRAGTGTGAPPVPITTNGRLTRDQIDRLTPAQKLARLARIAGGK